MMFARLSESIKKTISIADGYKLGRLIFEGENYEKPLIETEDREYTEVTDFVVEGGCVERGAELKIDIEKMKQYTETIKEMIKENKATGYDVEFLCGKLAVYEDILSGRFEGK